ncbi:hypothetical protein AB0M20_15575 [Actinoplanes sp. NPDC051633]|uniref:hypothetical protein n=1 Tax=Actinoplanes sp. NPDC051633 TaxID=3155670 RepID=UPI003428203B
MTDHHDAGHDGEHHFDHDFGPVDDTDAQDQPDLSEAHHEDDSAWDAPPEHEEQLPAWEDHQPEAELTTAAEHEQVGEDDAAPVNDEPVDLFPPQVDVGPLPEPVDGFPWVDSSSLGLIDAGTVGADALAAAPDPHELAEYAAEELPPAVDPWAALAESEDPATAALAKFYRPDQT